MITFKFERTQNAAFISHIDVLRITNRTLRRMGLPVDYSQGYNPHLLVNLSQPLPLGIASFAEWATAQSDFQDQEVFIKLYNKNCPPNFKAVACYVTKTKPNVAGKVTASDYFIKKKRAIEHKNQIEDLNKSSYIIKTKSKNGDIEKDISPLIHQIKVDEEGIYILCAFGNINLRVDKLAEKLNEDFNLDIHLYDIIRLNQYVDIDGDFIAVDKYIEGLE